MLDPDLPNLVSGDAGRLRQILLNLTGNAVKFTQSGEVSIECALLENTEHGVLVRYEISDTDIGIPADCLNALFQAFTQVDATTTLRCRDHRSTHAGIRWITAAQHHHG